MLTLCIAMACNVAVAQVAISHEDAFRDVFMVADIDCVKMLDMTPENIFNKFTLATVQQQLIALGFNPDKVDGVLGTKTRSALEEYCKIDNAYPHWLRILASHDFEIWAMPQADYKEISKTRLSGNVSNVISLLDRYKSQPPSFVSSWVPDDSLTSYSLTKADFELLKSPEVVLKKIAILQGETYPNEAKFEEALRTALKDMAGTKRYIQLVLQYAKPVKGASLTEKSFGDLKADNIPDYILQSIQGLKGLSFSDEMIEVKVSAIIDKLAIKVAAYKPQIIPLAAKSPLGASFTDDSLKLFPVAPKGDELLSAAILSHFKSMKGVVYQNEKTMASALNNMLMQMEDQINSYKPHILASAEKTMVYGLTDNSTLKVGEELAKFMVPEIYLVMLADLQDVDYLEQELFWLATKAKISMAGFKNAIKSEIFDVFDNKSAVKVDADLLDALKAALPPLPSAIISQLETLQGLTFDDTKALKTKVEELFSQLVAKDSEYDKLRPVIVGQARKTHLFDAARVIQWSGNSCNCVHNNLAGEVYGFYPYWMAGEKQLIDFSVQTRVGYYGLSFDDKGNIANSSRWSGLDTSFIREARTYGSKIDLIIYRNDWTTWSKGSTTEKDTAFKKLATEIVGLVGLPLKNFTSKAKPYVSLGGSPAPVMGDGVTLYFDSYPQDSASVIAFGKFIQTLRDRLEVQKRGYVVNIMFRKSEAGKGIYDYSELVKLMDIIRGDNQNSESRFLVLLQEPTTKDKKELRINIENGLHGEDRRKLLRNIVMVLTFDGHNDAQLKDDIIYAKDNFSGVGFWPQPVEAASSVAFSAVSTKLHDNYLNTENAESPYKDAVCQVVCPNRWVFRVAWDTFMLALLVCVVMYFRICAWKNFMNQHFIHFIAAVVMPTFLLTIVLLFCDPAWEAISKGNNILIFVVVTVIAYSIFNYYENKGKANLP